MAEKYERCARKSTKKVELLGGKEVAVRLPLPLVEVWEELQPEVEHLTGLAGLKIIRAVIEDEVTRRVGSRYRPSGEEGCLRWGQSTAGLRSLRLTKGRGGPSSGAYAGGRRSRTGELRPSAARRAPGNVRCWEASLQG
jgi:hypothetical protein